MEAQAMEASSVMLNGKSVRRISLNGGVLWEGGKEYEVLEYIESTGSQIIYTDIIPTSDTVVYCRFMPSMPQPRKYPRVFGTQNATTSDEGFIVCCYNDNKLFAGVRNNQNIYMTSTLTPTNNTIYEVWLMSNKFRVISGNVDETINNTATMPTLKLPLALFGGNEPVPNPWLCFSGRIYSFVVDDICNLIPVRRLSDGVLGMYDSVTKRFFTNQGTGTFIAGEPTGRKF